MKLYSIYYLLLTTDCLLLTVYATYPYVVHGHEEVAMDAAVFTYFLLPTYCVLACRPYVPC